MNFDMQSTLEHKNSGHQPVLMKGHGDRHQHDSEQHRLPSINWIRLKDLEKRLIDRHVPDSEGFLYLLASWIIFGSISFWAAITQYGNPGVIVVLLIIPVIALFLTWRGNQSGDGQEYLKRAISIHFVVGVRYLLLAACFTLLAETFLTSLSEGLLKGVLTGGPTAAIVLGYFFSLFRSVRRVARPAALRVNL